ncbi:MAG: hypothetical protein HY736_01130 [Verrucomicrobia bacterium]|nr:hypothetical protein [Verrucomicrobiota bacterium]
MQERLLRPPILLFPFALALVVGTPLAAQPLTRETPTTLVVPIPGMGVPGSVPGSGGGAVGTILPETLSQTGAFTDLAQLTPTRGLVAYELNASLWSDYAKKTRWFGLKSATSTFGFRRDGRWGLPIGAVWVKHFDLELRRGDPTSVRRVETRFLVRSPNDAEGRVTGYTYRWNDAQTDATLVPVGGATQVFQVTDNGVTRPQTWTFPSRLDCQTCHNSVGGPVLSFNTRQLNRPGRAGAINQIAALAQAGYLDVSSVPAPAALPVLVNAADTNLPLELRVRSYLDVNCAQCHRPGITGAGAFELLANVGAFDARAGTPLSLAGIVNGPLSFPLTDPAHRVLVPGSTTLSQILARIATRGPGHMPPLATSERDFASEALLEQWIAALAVSQPASRLLNLSARAPAGTGGNVLIFGFVIAPGAQKTVLVRAVGPALAPFGLGGALANPVLTLFDGAARPLLSNTRWNSAATAADVRSAAARVGAFALPEGSADSALFVTLPPGPYTVQTADADNAAGVALVEVYDAEPAASSATARLINTSVRAQVGADANILIPGLVVGPGAPKTLLIRAVGPGLAAFGVPGPLLAAPVVTLFAGGESYLANTGWNSAANSIDIRAAGQRVGAFALADGSGDSAILASFSPGPYTIQVSGLNGASGVALVEVYEVP